MRNFSKAKRVVIKIGTNTLTKNGGIVADYAGPNVKKFTHKRINRGERREYEVIRESGRRISGKQSIMGRGRRAKGGRARRGQKMTITITGN